METITIQKLEYKTSTNGSEFIKVNGNDYSIWAKHEDIESLGVLSDAIKKGEPVEVDIYIKGQYKNIIAIKGADGVIYKWDRSGNVYGPEGFLRPAPEGIVPPIQPKLQIDTAPEFEKEIKQGGLVLDQINVIVSKIKEGFDVLNEDELTKEELHLSALNVDIAKMYAANNSKANQLDLIFKDSITKKAKELQSIDPELSDTKAKTLAENSLWQDKVALSIQQDKANSNEVIINGINNLLFAIKDRLKFFRK